MGTFNMIIDPTYITAPNPVTKKPLSEVVQQVCEKIDPKPIFCELPEELRFKPFDNSGSIQTYTITSSSGASGYGTSTTTTTP